MSGGLWASVPWIAVTAAGISWLALKKRGWMRRLPPPTSVIWDCLLAAGLLVAFELYPLNPYAQTNGIRWDLVGAAMTVPIALRRRRTWAVWVWVTACGALLLASRADYNFSTGALALPPAPLVVLFAPLVALFTVALRTTRQRGRLALLASVATIEIALLGIVARVFSGIPFADIAFTRVDATQPDLLLTALLAAGMLVTAWALGETVRTRRESAALQAAAAEAERAERDRAVAAEERARIARELHDITAHHISVVALHAGAARLLAQSGHPPDAELLGGIETAST